MTRGAKVAGQFAFKVRTKVRVPQGNDRMILVKVAISGRDGAQTFEADEDESSWEEWIDLLVKGAAGQKIPPLILEIKASPSVYPGF
jgi:hypothetical protein